MNVSTWGMFTAEHLFSLMLKSKESFGGVPACHSFQQQVLQLFLRRCPRPLDRPCRPQLADELSVLANNLPNLGFFKQKQTSSSFSLLTKDTAVPDKGLPLTKLPCFNKYTQEVYKQYGT